MRRSLLPIVFSLLALLAVSLTTNAARAQGFCGAGAWGFFGNPWSVYSMETPPYFALHPPVYYSVPVPRTYGYSPFPYGPDVMTPEVLFEPETVVNPYVPQKETPAAPMSQKNVAGGPQRIDNPFVTVSHKPAADVPASAPAEAADDGLFDLLEAWSSLSDDERSAIREILNQAGSH